MTKARKRRRRRRLMELAEPKINWQVLKDRCPGYPGQPKWQSPARGSSSCQSRRPQPPSWKSGTPCQNPSHMCQTITASFTWPGPKLSRTSAFLTEILAGRCWMSPRRWWPAPGSSPWPSLKCARASTRDTTPITSPRPPWWPRRPLASMSLPPPKASPEKCDQPRPGL
ncbi:THEG isoform 3 [Pan troglodytes]|uniref:THEG isoform 3 n=1 Tax=Pan troglodytes TaxID=9598 RepID=A0A2J8QUX4_PANTR|nr:THEG isoform 3 [Pan troglodytes]